MANGPTRVCVFNVKANQQFAPPVVPNQTGSNLIDIVTGCDGVVVSSLGAASYGVPVVLNPNGVIDPSLLNTGVSAVASVNLSLGAPLVHLYSVGGVLTAELAEAGSGSPPSPALSAQGFLTSPIDAGQPGTIAFSGLFTYIDPNSEFSLSSVGAEVYLSAVTPGGITLTRPSSPSLDQTVGYVVAFAAPNVVTVIFLAGYSDFTRISGCLTTAQLCSVQGTGAFVQLTSGAPPPSPVTTQLGSSANYAILAAAGITNAVPATSVTGGVIGSFPTTSITGFNPPTATVDNADAAAALTDALTAYNYYSALTFTSLSGSSANLSVLGNGSNASTYTAGNYSAGSSMDIPTSITLDAQGDPSAVFVFMAGSTVTLESGASVLLVNGAQAANVVWIVGSSFTSVATSTMVGNILANTSITLGGGILTGRALAGIVTSSGAVSISAATAITVPSGAGAITAGDIVTFDVFGNTQDSGISLEGLLSSIFVNPMTTDGDMIYEGLAGSPPLLGPLRLPIGTTGQVLTVVGGVPAWQTTVSAQTYAAVTSQWLNSYDASTGLFTSTQPAYSDISGTPQLAQTFTSVAGEYLTGYTAGTGLFTAAPVSIVSGITISGTPTTGWILTATSGTTADWQAPSGGGTPGGANTDVQYNNSGVFGGDPTFVWDTTLATSAFAPALAIGNNIAGGAPFPNNRINVLESFTTTTPSLYAAYQAEIIVNGSGDFTGTEYVAYEATMATDGSANYGSVSTISTSYTHESSGTVGIITGISTAVSANPGTGAAATIVAVVGGAAAGADTNLVQGASFSARGSQGTVASLVGVEIAVVNSAPGVVTAGYGVKVDGVFNTGTFTTYYGVYTGVHAGTAPSTYWAFYAAEGNSFFGDPVTITPTNAGVALTVTGDATPSDIQEWYINGQASPNWGMAVEPYGDAQGVQLVLQDAAGDTATLLANQLILASNGTPYNYNSVLTANGLFLSDNEGNVFQAGYNGTAGSLLLQNFGITVASAPYLSIVGDGTQALAKFYVNAAAYTGTTPVITIDNAGNLDLISAGIKDSTGSLGTSGQLLSSTGSTVIWVTASYAPLASPTFTGTVTTPILTTGGLETAISTQTSNYTAAATDHTLNCNGTFTLTLPTAGISVGQEYYIKNIGTGTITVASTVNIDFSVTQTLSTQGQSLIVQWDGTQWWIY